MSQFARKRIINESSTEELPFSAKSDYVISNGSVSSSPITLANTPADGVDSNALYLAHNYDKVPFDMRKISPEKIAAQMTLIDLPLFKAIQLEEFRDCVWTKKDKLKLAPNIVAFTKRFNDTSFWVVQEVLKEPNLRARAEVIAHFIRIAKKLQELNNLHSMTAVVCALQSAPIYRLAQTWKCVHKRDRVTYDRQQALLSEQENWKQLREHMDAAHLPCIPHLAMYLTDLCFLHSLENRNTRKAPRQIVTVINMIAYCQNSTYDELNEEVHIKEYLQHTCYIDELLKFFEDEQYKLSLMREPAIVERRFSEKQVSMPGVMRASKSHEDLLTPYTSCPNSSHSQSAGDVLSSAHHLWTLQLQHRPVNLIVTGEPNSVASETAVRLSAVFGSIDLNGDAHVVASDLNESVSKKRRSTLPRVENTMHRMSSFLSNDEAGTRSVEREGEGQTGCVVGSSPALFREGTPSGSPPVPLPTRRRGHTKSSSLGTNVLAMLTYACGTKQSMSSDFSRGSAFSPVSKQIAPTDESVVMDTTTSYSGTPTGSLGHFSTSSGSEVEVEVEVEGEGEEEEEDLIIADVHVAKQSMVKEGMLKRKVTKRNGKSVPSFTRRKTKHWVQLTASSLLLYANRPTTKKCVKVKQISLGDCRVKYKDPTEKMNDKAFLILDSTGTQSKFSAKTPSVAQSWVEKIRSIINTEEQKQRMEAEKSLIKF